MEDDDFELRPGLMLSDLKTDNDCSAAGDLVSDDIFSIRLQIDEYERREIYDNTRDDDWLVRAKVALHYRHRAIKKINDHRDQLQKAEKVFRKEREKAEMALVREREKAEKAARHQEELAAAAENRRLKIERHNNRDRKLLDFIKASVSPQQFMVWCEACPGLND